MNWLVYIGGGFIFMLLSIVSFNSICSSAAEGIAVVFRVGWVIATLFIWIWLCWKFIKRR